MVFQKGAMPRLADLLLEFQLLPVQETREINSAFDLGLGNLLSLQDVIVCFRSRDSSEEEVEEAEAAVRQAIEVHPNHPRLWINGVCVVSLLIPCCVYLISTFLQT